MKTSLPLPREKSTIPTRAYDPRALSKFLLIPILSSSLPGAEITSTWNGSASQLWNNPANWTPAGSPSNTASDTFDVVLPAGLGSPVTANIFPTIDTLAIGAGSQLDLNLNITFTVRESITNDGTLSFGNSGNIILSLSSLTPASTTIDLLGSGEIAMGSAGHILFGTTGQLVRNGPSHTIRGVGELARSQLNLLNQGTITADDSGKILDLRPFASLVNDGGTLSATGGGILQIGRGALTNQNGGRLVVGDGSEIRLSGSPSLRDFTFESDDQDSNPANNLLTTATSSAVTLHDTVLEVPFQIGGNSDIFVKGSLTNEGEISVGVASGSEILIEDVAGDGIAELSGSGEIRLGTASSIGGTSGQTLRQQPNHRIFGNGNLGSGQVNFINQGLIHADDPGETLFLRPRESFVNDGGTIRVSGGAILEISSQTGFDLLLTNQAGGQLTVGDGSDVIFGGGRAEFSGFTFGIDDVDLDLANNRYRIANSAVVKFRDVTNNGNMTIGPNSTLRIENRLTDNGTIAFESLVFSPTLSFGDTDGDQICDLDGTGTLEIPPGEYGYVTGTSGHTLRIGPDYTLKDIYELGRNNLQIINQGTLYYPTGEFGSIIDTYQTTPFINEGLIDQPFIDNGLTSALVVLAPTINEGTMNINEGFGSNHGVVNRGTLNINQVWSSYITQEAGITNFNIPVGVVHLANYPLAHVFTVTGGEFRFGANGGATRSHLRLTGNGMISAENVGEISSDIGDGYGGADRGLVLEGGIVRSDIASPTEYSAFSTSTTTGNPDQISPYGFVNTPMIGSRTQLQLSYTGGPTTVSPADTFEILSYFNYYDAYPIGTFANVADGARITTIDGNASFQVNYVVKVAPNFDSGGSSAVVLSNFLHHDPPLADQPPVITKTTFSIPESVPLGSGFLRLEAYDPEGSALTFSLSGSAPFAISSALGYPSLVTTGLLNFEGQSSYTMDLTATANGLMTTVPITINVTDVVEDSNLEHVIDLLTNPGMPFAGETDPAIIGIGADPDGDGIPNIFELWLGTNPAVADPHPFPLLKVVTDGGTDHAAAEYEVVSSVDDLLTIQPQASFNLTGFRDVSASRAVLSDVGGVRRLEFRDALELTPPHTFFFRLVADDSPTP